MSKKPEEELVENFNKDTLSVMKKYKIRSIGDLTDTELEVFDEIISTMSIGVRKSFRVIYLEEYSAIVKYKDVAKDLIAKTLNTNPQSSELSEHKETYNMCMIMLARLEGKINRLQESIISDSLRPSNELN